MWNFGGFVTWENTVKDCRFVILSLRQMTCS